MLQCRNMHVHSAWYISLVRYLSDRVCAHSEFACKWISRSSSSNSSALVMTTPQYKSLINRRVPSENCTTNRFHRRWNDFFCFGFYIRKKIVSTTKTTITMTTTKTLFNLNGENIQFQMHSTNFNVWIWIWILFISTEICWAVDGRRENVVRLKYEKPNGFE